MPIEVRWGDEAHNYIYYRLIDPWDWDHYQAMCPNWRHLADEADGTVCTIVDFTETAHLPRGVLVHLQKFVVNPHPNNGVIVMVGANPLIRAIINTMQRLYPKAAKSLTLVTTREEAMTQVKNANGELVCEERHPSD